MDKINLKIKSIKPLRNKKFQLKIVQNDINMSELDIKGVHYKVLSSLGRGRFIIREDD